MNSTLLNIAIVLALILVEACFVASEIALVSLREGQVRAMAERGRRGQAVARSDQGPEPLSGNRADRGHAHRLAVERAFGAVTLSEQAQGPLWCAWAWRPASPAYWASSA